MSEQAEALRYIAQQIREARLMEHSGQAMHEVEQLLRGARDEYGAFAGPKFLRLRQILDVTGDPRGNMIPVFAWLCDNQKALGIKRTRLGIRLPTWPELYSEIGLAMNSGYVLKPYLPVLADLIDREADRVAGQSPDADDGDSGGPTDHLTDQPKKTKRVRPPTPEATRCGQSVRKQQAADRKISRKEAVENWLLDNKGHSFDTIYRTLSDNPNLWEQAPEQAPERTTDGPQAAG